MTDYSKITNLIQYHLMNLKMIEKDAWLGYKSFSKTTKHVGKEFFEQILNKIDLQKRTAEALLEQLSSEAREPKLVTKRIIENNLYCKEFPKQ